MSTSCPRCGKPDPMKLWGFNPLQRFFFCRFCSTPLHLPTYARVWGLGAVLLVMVVELLYAKEIGLWEPHGFAWLFLQAAGFLFVVFSSSFVGCLVCRKFAPPVLG